jgi:radical SAM protein with 4Fe4S-binding SPASM domain
MAGSNNDNITDKSIQDEFSHKEIVDYILKPAKEMGAFHIQYSGGEFLLREDALDIIKTSIEMDYAPRILTNGTLITEDLLYKLKKIAGRKLVIVFGINSITDRELNIETRDAEIENTVKTIQLCKEYKIKRHVIVNVNQKNLKSLETTFQWLADNKISFNRSPFAARMSGRNYFNDMCFSKKDMKDYIHPALLKRVNGYLSYTPFFLSPEVHFQVSGGESWNVTVPQNPFIGCWVGSWIAISAEGNVSPCVLLLDEVVAGNLRNKSLFNVIDDSPIFQNILNRDNLKGKCGKCRYKITCGGCRAMSYYHSGDYMNEDPTCFFEPIDESTVSKFENITNILFKKHVLVASYAGMYKRPVINRNNYHTGNSQPI